MKSETCANCDRKIGKLETPHVWDDHVVCGACRTSLAAERDVSRPARVAAAAEGVAVRDEHAVLAYRAEPPRDSSRGVVGLLTRPLFGRGDIRCPNPNCGYVGPPVKVARGSLAVGCLLSLLMLLPGLIYFAFMGGYRYLCPRCGLQVAADN